ncbi:PREDICTED: putative disease resistance protein RGA1, partial [Ipomoea nil]|uniref:putative disease resistance protein RGA1 n=1 Tax=Ipomoea nil TaxID=35883 RepID=UPI000900A046
MAFAAVTILMDTLHQHFLQLTPRFPLRNKTKVRLLYKHLSSLQTSLEQDFNMGECDEAIKALEAQMRDVSIELRFQIEHHLTLFYIGKSMKLRLHSAQKLLPILNEATKGGIETMDLECVSEMLRKHFTLPVAGMPAHIKRMVISFCTQYGYLFYKRWSKVKEESGDEEENGDELESEDELESGDEEESRDEEETEDEWENKEEQKSDDEQRSMDEQETEEEQNSDDEQGSQDEHEDNDGEWETEVLQPILSEAESIIRQELRVPSYLNKYMKQRIQARHKINQIFMQGIKLTSYIKKEMLKVKNAHYNQSNTPQGNNTCASLRLIGPKRENITVGDSLQHTTIEMVGCDDEFNMIMDNLKQQSKQREIVSIVGMGGIGKTTLAKRIYGDASFISRFDCRAWVTISQDYNPIKVLKALLCSLDPTRVVCEEKNELAMRVDKCVKGKRYLIVIDDIWSTNVLDDLMRCFKDGKNGSRMLLTTRLKNVAEYADSRGNLCHSMRFLNSYESWNLFHNKVLSQRITLSPEFERIGREIVNKCKGLPLAINVVAGLLSKPKQDLNEWELIAKNVHTLSIDHSNQQGENIIDLSYTFLPHHLKHCFLLIGGFPEDSKLPEPFIVDILVSGGFLKVLRSKSLEDVARESLQDLVDRNLLLISTKMTDDGESL